MFKSQNDMFKAYPENSFRHTHTHTTLKTLQGG